MMVSSDYIKSLLKKGFRLDHRNVEEYRQPVEVEYSVSSKSAEGSARVRIGDTEVVAGVKLELGEPFPDVPDEGTIVVNVELLPMSSPEYEPGPPGIDAVEISRVVDRGIREAHAVDFKKLYVPELKKMWMVMIDIYPINAAGNLFDACALAAIAALKDAHFPTLKEEDGKIDYMKKTNKPLPLEKLPVSCTVHKIAGKFLIDPVRDEEKASEARLTVAFTEKGNICAMQKGGKVQLTSHDIEAMVNIADKKTKELRDAL